MPVNITIRNVPDEVRDELAARAARSGRSLQEFLSAEFVRIASTPSAAEAAVRARMGASLNPALTAGEIVAAVHEGRR
ncbi:FitA-like ribbon-helix-helix domain-containing protein [Microbacterium sp. F2]|jgi:plasmid stability protein|uniref:FitA-like ribbon-helix-helix domain-containing protein n=1 Tax=Microbacterium sp. F2 TaxID=3422228 RepID=UPI003FD0443C